ncbi:MAG TPA: hypothetical protein VNS53_01660, partial [Sphingomicrobium sp.]|nr:hypothetical protein [Sphingomicrobium sp.]
HDSARPFLIRELEEPVGSPPQLERVAGLQAFAFEPDSGAADLAFDQRRPLDEAGDSLRRGCDVIAGDELLIR